MPLLKESWPLGWNPNSDNINGDPRGLLRADNLTQEEEGALVLIRGTLKISSGAFASEVTQIFGKTLDLATIGGAGYSNNSKVRYVVVGTNIYRNFGPGTKLENVFDIGIVTGGGTAGAAFGYGFGHIFITYGTKLAKDNGITQTTIGQPANVVPTVVVNAPPSSTLAGGTDTFGLWDALENGSVFSSTGQTYIEIDSDPVTNQAVAIKGITLPATIDLTVMGGVSGESQDEDIFSISVRIGDTSKFVKVSVAILLETPTAVSYIPDATNYYYYEWIASEPQPVYVEPLPPDEVDGFDTASWLAHARRIFDLDNPIKLNAAINLGIDVWSNLNCKRSSFQRVGTDDALGWANCKGIKVSFTTTEQQTFAFTNMKFEGGLKGPLLGEYSYLQVDVQNNGYYTEKSLPSPTSAYVTVTKSSTTVTPHTVAAQCNECWTFRAGGSIPGYYLVDRQTGANGFTPVVFIDTKSDVEALRDDIQLDYYQANLPAGDGIIGMECNWKGRNWYISYKNIYPSLRDNVSSYDTRYVLENQGNAEYNFFITRLSADTLILATTVDFYEITGSAGVILQGETEFFDLQIKPLGIKSPTISKSFVVREGNLFYLAADGIRVLSGSTCSLVSERIDLLFNNYTRHGLSPLTLIRGDLHFLAISKNRLYFTGPQADNVRACYVYSFVDKNWRYEEHGNTEAMQALFVEEDDTLIFSTASFGDKYLYKNDVGTLLNNASNIPFKFLTIFDHDGKPRNRKDSYTLKITADTGNVSVNVILRGYRDDATVVTHTTTASFNGRVEKYFSIYTDIGLVKYYQLEINGTVPVCKIYNFSVDYDARPEQLNNLRIPPTNFGIAGRKRIPEIPMVIDTLGNTITFTPIIDGVAKTTSAIVTSDKAVFHHMFTSDEVGFNIGGLLAGTLFEFYELVNPREVELLPDPLKYKFIPYTNLGTGSRKRFIQYAIVIDTRSSDVTFTPIIDTVNQTSLVINTARKRTVTYTFDNFAIGTDIASTLSGTNQFEFYEINLSECISEKLPPLAQFLHIPYTNFNTSSRKRIIQYAFTINTFGQSVTFIPYVDGVAYPSQNYSADRKQTVIYTFSTLTVGIDIGGTLNGVYDFEFYGPNIDESVYEKLPPLAKAITIKCTNYGIAAKKRIRTIPMVIDTFGHDVIYTPSVDGVTYTTSTFNTNGRRTVLHYFERSSINEGSPFGIDYCGTLVGAYDFEFYELLQPENVETLPVGKKFDQFGPIEFSKIGKIKEISILLMATGATLNFRLYAQDSLILNGNIVTTPNIESNYIIKTPKGINPNIFRMEIDSTFIFHRFKSEIKVNVDGAQTENKRITIDSGGNQVK